MEEALVAFMQKVGLELVEVFVEVRERQGQGDAWSMLVRISPRGARRTTLTGQSPFGPLRVRDPYAYCRSCQSSGRPLHSWLGTARETWSLIVEEAAVDLASDESVGKAVAKLARNHPGVEMDRTAALRMLHAHGKEARQFIDEKLAGAAQLAELPPVERGAGAAELEVEFDAGMVPVATLEPIPVPVDQEPELTPVRGLSEPTIPIATTSFVSKPGTSGEPPTRSPTRSTERPDGARRAARSRAPTATSCRAG